MQHIFAFFCTSFLGAVLGANFPNNIQIGEWGARGAVWEGYSLASVLGWRGGGGRKLTCLYVWKGKMCLHVSKKRGGEQPGLDLCVGSSFARAEMCQFGFGGRGRLGINACTHTHQRRGRKVALKWRKHNKNHVSCSGRCLSCHSALLYLQKQRLHGAFL